MYILKEKLFAKIEELEPKMVQTLCECGFPATPVEGTYLVWMDCRSLNRPSEELEEALVADAKLWLNAGTMYGEAGEGGAHTAPGRFVHLPVNQHGF